MKEPLLELKNIPFPCGLHYHPSFSFLDSSKLTSYMECGRRYFFEYLLGWRPEIGSIHTDFGSAVHVGMEHMLNGGDADEAYALFYDHLTKIHPPPYDHPTKNPEKARLMFQAYEKHYSDTWRVKYTEIVGKVPIILDPYRVDLTLRIDAVVEDTYGLVVIDHKTASRFDKLWEAQFNLSVQVNCYLHAAASHWGWDNVFGFLVNGIAFMKRKENPYEFKRAMIRRTPRAIEQWIMTCRTWIDKYLWEMNALNRVDPKASTMRVEGEGHFGSAVELFPQNPKSCTNYGMVCPYMDMCEAWHNPLDHIGEGEAPTGMVVERWDPTERDFNYELTDGEIK